MNSTLLNQISEARRLDEQYHNTSSALQMAQKIVATTQFDVLGRWIRPTMEQSSSNAEDQMDDIEVLFEKHALAREARKEQEEARRYAKRQGRFGPDELFRAEMFQKELDDNASGRTTVSGFNKRTVNAGFYLEKAVVQPLKKRRTGQADLNAVKAGLEKETHDLGDPGGVNTSNPLSVMLLNQLATKEPAFRAAFHSPSKLPDPATDVEFLVQPKTANKNKSKGDDAAETKTEMLPEAWGVIGPALCYEMGSTSVQDSGGGSSIPVGGKLHSQNDLRYSSLATAPKSAISEEDSLLAPLRIGRPATAFGLDKRIYVGGQGSKYIGFRHRPISTTMAGGQIELGGMLDRLEGREMVEISDSETGTVEEEQSQPSKLSVYSDDMAYDAIRPAFEQSDSVSLSSETVASDRKRYNAALNGLMGIDVDVEDDDIISLTSKSVGGSLGRQSRPRTADGLQDDVSVNSELTDPLQRKFHGKPNVEIKPVDTNELEEGSVVSLDSVSVNLSSSYALSQNSQSKASLHKDPRNPSLKIALDNAAKAVPVYQLRASKRNEEEGNSKASTDDDSDNKLAAENENGEIADLYERSSNSSYETDSDGDDADISNDSESEESEAEETSSESSASSGDGSGDDVVSHSIEDLEKVRGDVCSNNSESSASIIEIDTIARIRLMRMKMMEIENASKHSKVEKKFSQSGAPSVSLNSETTEMKSGDTSENKASTPNLGGLGQVMPDSVSLQSQSVDQSNGEKGHLIQPDSVSLASQSVAETSEGQSQLDMQLRKLNSSSAHNTIPKDSVSLASESLVSNGVSGEFDMFDEQQDVHASYHEIHADSISLDSESHVSGLDNEIDYGEAGIMAADFHEDTISLDSASVMSGRTGSAHAVERAILDHKTNKFQENVSLQSVSEELSSDLPGSLTALLPDTANSDGGDYDDSVSEISDAGDNPEQNAARYSWAILIASTSRLFVKSVVEVCIRSYRQYGSVYGVGAVGGSVLLGSTLVESSLFVDEDPRMIEADTIFVTDKMPQLLNILSPIDIISRFADAAVSIYLGEAMYKLEKLGYRNKDGLIVYKGINDNPSAEKLLDIIKREKREQRRVERANRKLKKTMDRVRKHEENLAKLKAKAEKRRRKKHKRAHHIKGRDNRFARREGILSNLGSSRRSDRPESSTHSKNSISSHSEKYARKEEVVPFKPIRVSVTFTGFKIDSPPGLLQTQVIQGDKVINEPRLVYLSGWTPRGTWTARTIPKAMVQREEIGFVPEDPNKPNKRSNKEKAPFVEALPSFLEHRDETLRNLQQQHSSLVAGTFALDGINALTQSVFQGLKIGESAFDSILDTTNPDTRASGSAIILNAPSTSSKLRKEQLDVEGSVLDLAQESAFQSSVISSFIPEEEIEETNIAEDTPRSEKEEPVTHNYSNDFELISQDSRSEDYEYLDLDDFSGPSKRTSRSPSSQSDIRSRIRDDLSELSADNDDRDTRYQHLVSDNANIFDSPDKTVHVENDVSSVEKSRTNSEKSDISHNSERAAQKSSKEYNISMKALDGRDIGRAMTGSSNSSDEDIDEGRLEGHEDGYSYGDHSCKSGISLSTGSGSEVTDGAFNDNHSNSVASADKIHTQPDLDPESVPSAQLRKVSEGQLSEEMYTGMVSLSSAGTASGSKLTESVVSEEVYPGEVSLDETGSLRSQQGQGSDQTDARGLVSLDTESLSRRQSLNVTIEDMYPDGVTLTEHSANSRRSSAAESDISEDTYHEEISLASKSIVNKHTEIRIDRSESDDSEMLYPGGISLGSESEPGGRDGQLQQIQETRRSSAEGFVSLSSDGSKGKELSKSRNSSRDNSVSLESSSIGKQSIQSGNAISVDSSSTILMEEKDLVSLNSQSSTGSGGVGINASTQSKYMNDEHSNGDDQTSASELPKIEMYVDGDEDSMGPNAATIWWPELEAPRKAAAVTFADDVPQANEKSDNARDRSKSVDASVVLPQLSSYLENDKSNSITSLQRELVLHKPPEWSAAIVRIYQEMKFEIRDGVTTELLGTFSIPFSDLVSNLGDDRKSKRKLKLDIRMYRKGEADLILRGTLECDIDATDPVLPPARFDDPEHFMNHRPQHWTVFPNCPINIGIVRQKYKDIAKQYDRQRIVNPSMFGFRVRFSGDAKDESKFTHPMFTGYTFGRKPATKEQMEALHLQEVREMNPNPWRWQPGLEKLGLCPICTTGLKGCPRCFAMPVKDNGESARPEDFQYDPEKDLAKRAAREAKYTQKAAAIALKKRTRRFLIEAGVLSDHGSDEEQESDSSGRRTDEEEDEPLVKGELHLHTKLTTMEGIRLWRNIVQVRLTLWIKVMPGGEVRKYGVEADDPMWHLHNMFLSHSEYGNTKGGMLILPTYNGFFELDSVIELENEHVTSKDTGRILLRRYGMKQRNNTIALLFFPQYKRKYLPSLFKGFYNQNVENLLTKDLEVYPELYYLPEDLSQDLVQNDLKLIFDRHFLEQQLHHKAKIRQREIDFAARLHQKGVEKKQRRLDAIKEEQQRLRQDERRIESQLKGLKGDEREQKRKVLMERLLERNQQIISDSASSEARRRLARRQTRLEVLREKRMANLAANNALHPVLEDDDEDNSEDSSGDDAELRSEVTEESAATLNTKGVQELSSSQVSHVLATHLESTISLVVDTDQSQISLSDTSKSTRQQQEYPSVSIVVDPMTPRDLASMVSLTDTSMSYSLKNDLNFSHVMANSLEESLKLSQRVPSHDDVSLDETTKNSKGSRQSGTIEKRTTSGSVSKASSLRNKFRRVQQDADKNETEIDSASVISDVSEVSETKKTKAARKDYDLKGSRPITSRGGDIVEKQGAPPSALVGLDLSKHGQGKTSDAELSDDEDSVVSNSSVQSKRKELVHRSIIPKKNLVDGFPEEKLSRANSNNSLLSDDSSVGFHATETKDNQSVASSVSRSTSKQESFIYKRFEITHIQEHNVKASLLGHARMSTSDTSDSAEDRMSIPNALKSSNVNQPGIQIKRNDFIKRDNYEKIPKEVAPRVPQLSLHSAMSVDIEASSIGEIPEKNMSHSKELTESDAEISSSSEESKDSQTNQISNRTKTKKRRSAPLNASDHEENDASTNQGHSDKKKKKKKRGKEKDNYEPLVHDLHEHTRGLSVKKPYSTGYSNKMLKPLPKSDKRVQMAEEMNEQLLRSISPPASKKLVPVQDTAAKTYESTFLRFLNPAFRKSHKKT